MTIRAQLLVSFLILIFIFVADFLVTERLSKQVLTNTVYLNNSEAVIRNSNMLHKEMIKMQSAFRGFLLTGQESFLEPYYQGLRSIPSLLKEQRLQAAMDKQKLALDSIGIIHAEWIEYADSLILTKRDTLPQASKKYRQLFEGKLKMEVGKKLNDKVEHIFARFDAYEYRIRQQRKDVLQLSIKRTRDITLALTVISIVLALVAGFYFIRRITERILRMIGLARKISDGDFLTITDTKKDEFNKLTEALNKMSGTLDHNFKALKKNNSELDQFAYVVSHDLKAPIRGISNIILWMEEDHAGELTEDIKKNHTLIKGRIARLESMIDGLLTYARIGRIRKEIQAVDIGLLLQELTALLVPAGFEVMIENGMPFITTEKLLIEQVFSNLISNAVKYSDKPRGSIAVSFRDRPGHYEFSVSDNGKGIEQVYFEKIFIIFQTLQERDAFESTGVGLAIVKKIIEDKKASIRVSSEPGAGSVFTFTWPKN